jgi:hypothetical protein
MILIRCGGGTVIYGYNATGIGSISPTATQANGPVVAVCQWNAGNQTLQLNYTASLGNGKFGRIVIGTTSFYRTAATFTAGSPDRWNWTTATNPFGTVSGATRNFDIFYEDPDLTVSVVAPANIGASDDRFGVTVNGIDVAGENVYGVGLNGNDTSDILATTVPFVTTSNTGAPSVSFEVTTELPALNQTRTYYLYAGRTNATGGAGGPNNEGPAAFVYTGRSFSVTRLNTPSVQPTVEPTLEPYGLAIYDNAGALVTSFSEEVMLNRVFTTDIILSSTGSNTITGVPTSATNANSIITVDLALVASTETPPPPGIITSPGTITLAASQSNFQGARVSVLQYRDIPATGYGLIVRNGLNEGIINENTVSYGVSEVHTINPALTSLVSNVIPGTEQSRSTTITLTGTYPINKTAPVVAIKSTHGDFIIKPFLYSSNSVNYDKLFVFLPKDFTSGTEWKVAILLPSDVVTPQNYGSATYGLDVRNSSGVTTWSSNWKQGIISHVQDANVFTTGTNQNGLYDVETGFDGVTVPAFASSEVYAQLVSNGQTLNVTTRKLDPANTFISFSSCQGRIQYNGGVKLNDLGQFQYNAGGGTHYPAARVNSSTSASLTMFRVADFNPAGETDRLRMPRSHHPAGFIMFMRIPGI